MLFSHGQTPWFAEKAKGREAWPWLRPQHLEYLPGHPAAVGFRKTEPTATTSLVLTANVVREGHTALKTQATPPSTTASLSPPVGPFAAQLCPLFPHDQDTFNCLLSPAAVMSFKDKDSMKNVEVSRQHTTPSKALGIGSGLRGFICTANRRN